jgi:hypothetical protein
LKNGKGRKGREEEGEGKKKWKGRRRREECDGKAGKGRRGKGKGRGRDDGEVNNRKGRMGREKREEDFFLTPDWPIQPIKVPELRTTH